MKTKFILLLFSFLIFTSSYAQQTEITGTVTSFDDNMTLPGVNIVIKGSTKGVSTDFDGNYKINVNDGDVLEFSFIGYKTMEIVVNNQTTIDVALQTDAESLDEIIVVGYGTQKKSDLTGAITTIKSDEIVKTPTGQAMQAMQGKVAGLQVVSTGSPGDSPTVRVRGVNSYPGSGNSNPLYIVDGMFYDNIDFLNTYDIESMSVLKDASSSAIYGVRASNGVILIETKSGKFNRVPEITYNTYMGYQVAQNVLKMANAEQFTTMAYESGSQSDIDNILNAMQRYGRSRVNPNIPDVNTDWYNEVIKPGLIYNHDLDVTGGGENVSYSIGGNYFSQEGILKTKNKYERFNLRARIDVKAKDWLTIGSNVIFSNATKYDAETSAWNQAYFAVPILPIYDELNTEAYPTNYANAQDLGYRSGQNPFPTLDFNNNKSKIRKTIANFYLNFDLIPEKLSFKTTYSHSNISLNRRNVDLPYFIGNDFQRPDSGIVKTTETISNQIWDNVLTYTDSFNNHNLTVMGGTSYRDESFQWLSGSGLNFPTENEETWYLNFVDPETETNSDGGSREYGLSYFGRVSYNYDNKYLVYATMRADGSRKYQEKWGYFPAVGLGWVLTEEEFLKDNKILEFFKLRAGWGKLGNDSVASSVGANITSVTTTAIDDEQITGTITSSDFAYLKWEYTEELNFGISSRLFDSHLSIEADYYIRDTKDAVIPILRPLIGGSVRRNLGEIRNSGFEMALSWNDQISEDWSYHISGNFATLKNEVRDLNGQEYIDGGSAEFRQRTYVGESLFAFYGREIDGVYQNDAEIQADPIAIDNGLVPGDFKYKDQNNDGILDDDDRVILGSYLPSFTYGAEIGVNYKNFEFSASLYGQTGNKILNRKRGEIIWTSDLNMDADLAINRWHGEGTTNSYPSSAGLRKGWNQKMSDFFVEDGSFFRIQNIQVAYTLDNKQLFGANMPLVRISMTADRPLTIFKYNGFNPEIANGIDTQNYPTPSVYTLGLNIKF